jgi:tetratricopeptide (TPR) repeat protein
LDEILDFAMDFDDDTEDMGSGDAGGSRRKSSLPSKMEADDDDGVEEVTPTASPKRMAQNEEDSDDDFELEEEEEEEEVKILSTNIPIKPRNNVVKNPCHAGTSGIRGGPINTFKKMRTPDVIDLTEESSAEEIEMDDSVVILDAPSVELEDFDFPELVEVAPVSKKDIAEDNRKTGNDHFKRGEYNQALCAYTRAIGMINTLNFIYFIILICFFLSTELVPNETSYYGNRAACFIMMRRFKEALIDCQMSLQIDSTYEKVKYRILFKYLLRKYLTILYGFFRVTYDWYE